MYEEDKDRNWNREPEEERPKKGGILKKAAWITAGALLFGTIAGGVMVGVQIASSGVFKNLYAIVSGEPEAGDWKAPEGQKPPADPFAGPETATPSYIAAPVTDVSVIVEEAMPSVVAITSTAVYQSRDFGYDWFFGGGLGGQTYEVPSSGSGIIIGENETELLIVTNNHVVEEATSLKVTFIDEETVDAVTKGTDPETDLAVIAIPLDQIKEETKAQIHPAVVGNSDELKPGQGVIAIGNALGYGQSVTVGYISAINREVQTEEGNTRVLLQTDAAINPGNSGGALLNMKGEVIGINSNKIGGTAVEGMGYAIPITSASPIIADLMERQTRTKVAEDEVGYIGISLQEVTSQISQMYNMPEGIYVVSVEEGSAAANAGIMKGDIITKFDGSSISSYSDLQKTLQYYAVGDSVTVTVQRPQNGEYVSIELNLTLGSRPASQK